jgi:hypothetical protein
MRNATPPVRIALCIVHGERSRGFAPPGHTLKNSHPKNHLACTGTGSNRGGYVDNCDWNNCNGLCQLSAYRNKPVANCFRDPAQPMDVPRDLALAQNSLKEFKHNNVHLEKILCLKHEQPHAPQRTGVRGSQPPLKRGNLSAKSFITSAKENTGRARPARPSPLDCPRPGVQGSDCLYQREVRLRRTSGAVRDVITKRDELAMASRPACVPAP